MATTRRTAARRKAAKRKKVPNPSGASDIPPDKVPVGMEYVPVNEAIARASLVKRNGLSNVGRPMLGKLADGSVSDRGKKIKRLRQDSFLAAFEVCGTISHASRAAGVSIGSHYHWIRDDPDYVKRFDEAVDNTGKLLEEVARNRALHGTLEPVIKEGSLATVCVDEDGNYRIPHRYDSDTMKYYDEEGRPLKQEPLMQRKMSDTLLIFLMKGAMPGKYKDRQELTGPGNKPLNFSPAVVVLPSNGRDVDDVATE